LGGAKSTLYTSLDEAFYGATYALRGSPISRIFSHLHAARRHGLRDRPASTSRCLGGSGRILPMHLPDTSGLYASLPKGRRRRARRSAYVCATHWVEMLISMFNFYELSHPKSDSEIAQGMGKYTTSSDQDRAFECLVRECVPFCRLKAEKSDLGRGQRSLAEILKELESNFSDNLGQVDFSSTVASRVQPDRVHLPTTAGTCDPRDWLDPDVAKFAENPYLLKLPEEEWPRPLPNVCHLVDPEDEIILAKKFLNACVATLVPESLIPRDKARRLIVSGWFAVWHSIVKDRLIQDRRRPNSTERRVRRCVWPQGSMFAHFVLDIFESIRGSSRDLKSFYFQLYWSCPELNCVGRSLAGEDFTEFGGLKGIPYRLGLTVLGQGNVNACDIATFTHAAVLQSKGCLAPMRTMYYGEALPRTDLKEGLVIDDYVCMWQSLTSRILDRSRGPDLEIMKDADDAHASAALEQSADKSVNASTNFTVWGTQVRGLRGVASSPLSRLAMLYTMTTCVLGLEFICAGILRRIVALFMHPFLLRRVLMSCFHRTFKWIETNKHAGWVRWPHDIRSELMCAACLLPFSYADMRMPISPVLSCTDATPTHGGGAYALVTPEIAREIYDAAETRGEYVRLDSAYKETPTRMRAAPSHVVDVFNSLDWRVSRSYAYGSSAHVNLQELRGVKAELVERVCRSTEPERIVNGCDSRVTVGCWAKGRSSSFAMNGIMQSVMAWCILGHKLLVNVWLPTDKNASDPPSRRKMLRHEPVSSGAGREPLPGHEDLPVSGAPPPMRADVAVDSQCPHCAAPHDACVSCDRCSHTCARCSYVWGRLSFCSPAPEATDLDFTGLPARRCRERRSVDRDLKRLYALGHCLEVYSGVGHLSAELRHAGLRTSRPYECYPSRRMYIRELDIDIYENFRDLLSRIHAKEFAYVHFGIPCKSWSLMQNMNHGSRTKDKPLGDGLLAREKLGNLQARRVAVLCRAISSVGGLWSIENPRTSYLFEAPCIRKLYSLPNVFEVHFDQCEYGLCHPEGEPNTFYKKSTTVVSNVAELAGLERYCSGNHKHIRVIGGTHCEGRCCTHSQLAGRYPKSMCIVWAQCIKSALRRLLHHC